MSNFFEFIENDNFLVISFFLNIVLLILILICLYKISKISKNYLFFMKKIGNAKLDNDVNSCIQKIGLVRYNAFRDVGSDLSFAIALLDNNDNGVVLNGLYGSESSNIYAKPIKNGGSTYQLSEEEKYAIEIAEQNKNFIARHKNNGLIK